MGGNQYGLLKIDLIGHWDNDGYGAIHLMRRGKPSLSDRLSL